MPSVINEQLMLGGPRHGEWVHWRNAGVLEVPVLKATEAQWYKNPISWLDGQPVGKVESYFYTNEKVKIGKRLLKVWVGEDYDQDNIYDDVLDGLVLKAGGAVLREDELGDWVETYEKTTA